MITFAKELENEARNAAAQLRAHVTEEAACRELTAEDLMKATKQVKREARQLFRMCHVQGVISDSRVRQVLQSVLKTKRRGYRALANQFERLVKLEQGQQTAAIERATPLSSDLQTTVRERLTRSYSERLNTTFNGSSFGMRIRVSSDVYDGRIRARLEDSRRKARD